MSVRSVRILGAICVVVGFLAWGIVTPALMPAMSGGGYPPHVNWDRVTWNVCIAAASTGALFGFGVGMLIASLLRNKPKD